MQFADCSAVRLCSKEGHPYWFRTCDIGDDVWAAGAHLVSFPKGGKVVLSGWETPFYLEHQIMGMTYNRADTWLLDGMNDAGLTGGLLALGEGTSVPKADTGETGVMGMELVTFLLGCCVSVEEVAQRARQVRVLDVPFGDKGTPATMHYMFLDASGHSVILEAANEKEPGILTVYEKNLGLMTNSPPYPRQIENLCWFLAHSPELNWGAEKPATVTLNGVTVTANPNAGHESMGGIFPASYAPCDRFVRLALLTALNEEGRQVPDRQMLPFGSQLMSVVVEPHNRGIFHYIRFDEVQGPIGGHESFSQYLIMYDLVGRALYIRPYDSTAWSRLRLSNCSGEQLEHHPVCRDPLGGVVEG